MIRDDKTPTLVPNGYRPRLVEGRLDALMHAFGCVEIIGPKWCGKTWMALSRARSVTRLDQEMDRSAAEVDPNLALLGDTPHLVDEWQEVPGIWDAARHQIDGHGSQRGLFLFTGSVALTKAKLAEVHHSGAGRIARIRMRPLSLFESGESDGTESLSALFAGKDPVPTRHETSIQEVVEWCCRGGWPATLGLDLDAAMETPSQYIQATLDVNVMDEGRSPQTALSLMRALALNASRAATHKTLRADMGPEPPASDLTLTSYLEMLNNLFLIEDLPGWAPATRAKERVRTKPKRYFSDPSLAAALLGATPEGLLRDMQTLGDLFENLCVRDLGTYLSTYPGLGNRMSYYRDDKGLEVDIVLEKGTAWAGIEVKLSEAKVDQAAENLLRLREKITRNKAARVPEPAFLAVVVGAGNLAYRRPDGVFVLPIATLAP